MFAVVRASPSLLALWPATDELIRQIRAAPEAGLYYLALFGALALPDIWARAHGSGGRLPELTNCAADGRCALTLGHPGSLKLPERKSRESSFSALPIWAKPCTATRAAGSGLPAIRSTAASRRSALGTSRPRALSSAT
jgi:hypothetical protein